jgi:hypothetical protein
MACMEKNESAYKVLVGKPEGKRPTARPRIRCEGNNNMVKRKVFPVLNYIIKHHTLKAYAGVEIQLHHLWSRRKLEVNDHFHAAAAFTPDTHWIGSWVGRTLRGTGKFLSLSGDQTLAVQPVAIRAEPSPYSVMRWF